MYSQDLKVFDILYIHFEGGEEHVNKNSKRIDYFHLTRDLYLVFGAERER